MVTTLAEPLAVQVICDRVSRNADRTAYRSGSALLEK
jgi:hypothetical protein